jgi:hypothetical protein
LLSRFESILPIFVIECVRRRLRRRKHGPKPMVNETVTTDDERINDPTFPGRKCFAVIWLNGGRASKEASMIWLLAMCSVSSNSLTSLDAELFGRKDEGLPQVRTIAPFRPFPSFTIHRTKFLLVRTTTKRVALLCLQQMCIVLDREFGVMINCNSKDTRCKRYKT